MNIKTSWWTVLYIDGFVYIVWVLNLRNLGRWISFSHFESVPMQCTCLSSPKYMQAGICEYTRWTAVSTRPFRWWFCQLECWNWTWTDAVFQYTHAWGNSLCKILKLSVTLMMCYLVSVLNRDLWNGSCWCAEKGLMLLMLMIIQFNSLLCWLNTYKGNYSKSARSDK